MADKQQTVLKSGKIAAGAVVCVESEIRGDVTIGARTVVHPKARINAEAGPIIIGEGNLIEEQALIINSYPENIMPESEDVEPKTMSIGINNVFEVGCVSQALKIGDNNVIESKADVGRNVILTSGCIIGACCQVNTCEVIPENTVIYGSNCMRRIQTEKPQIVLNLLLVLALRKCENKVNDLTLRERDVCWGMGIQDSQHVQPNRALSRSVLSS
ncbi:dynactin subunit 6-like isoform X1 [Alosa alosa]|uniref:dynactin subunit 6-like isoform X1 n=1 Tax=Alosa alosa TaxID=278164 RepID=UPI0020151BA5|nr:dynactin subunit 6-like isoform X1 [Alosa alosa]